MERIQALKKKFLETTEMRLEAVLSLCKSEIDQQFLIGLLEYNNRDVANSRIEFIAREIDQSYDSSTNIFTCLEYFNFPPLQVFFTCKHNLTRVVGAEQSTAATKA